MGRFLTMAIGLVAGVFLFSVVQAKEPPVTFPEGWKVTEEVEDGDTSWDATPAQGKEDPTISVLQVSGIPFSQTTLNELLNEMVKQFLGETKAVFKSVKCGEKKPVFEDMKQIASITCKIKGLTNMRFALVEGGGSAFLMLYEAEDAFFDKYLPAWHAVLKSVKVK